MNTTIEENKALITRFGEAMNTRQLDLLDDIVAHDFVRHCQATPQVNVTSREAFKEYLRQDSAVFPDSVQTLKFLIAEEDVVGIWGTYEGTQMGAMGPFPPSRKRMCLEFSGFLRVQHGRITEMWVIWDNMAALGQLGHLPSVPPPSP